MRGLQNRLRLLSLFLFLFALLLVSRLYFIQIVSGENFKTEAARQYVAGINYFDRGLIYFTTKDGTLVPAASIKTGFILHINSSILSQRTDLEEIYETINTITPIDKEDFLAKAGKKNDLYEELARRLPTDVAEKIRALKISGLSAAEERWRIYPGGTIAAHAIGLIGYSGDELAGRYGLERFYELVLKRSGDNVFVNFFAEIFSNIKKAASEDESLEGDIVTTIEPTVEAFLESEIEKVTLKYSSDFTGGIVINPRTGAIYAMALTPTFDPNYLQRERGSAVFSNRLVEDRYEMGSILKALTLAIGINSNAITARTTYNDPGCITLNTRTFCNYDGKSHGSGLSMQFVLNKSLNTGAAFVASRVGSSNFNDYMLRFGLETITGIDLPNEGKSLISNLKTNRDLESAQASFGQGIALTPITTVRALSALANGGTLITPHLVKEIKYKLGPTKTLVYPSKEERGRVISEEASVEISRMLTEVVDRSLRDGRVRLENYSIAAKTGTAQIARPGGGGYYDDRYLHSFFGYFPSYEPEFLVFLYTYYPKGVQYASETLTDTFINITKFLINYYGIPPDREASPPARP
ncbi:MAG: penicillin-binding protein 2 [bacterium]|nr:penicillin-binding protein 2 [bacterium]MDZ4206077.1 penicillin-binding protein 2 [Patescibacteria group bacterium]